MALPQGRIEGEVVNYFQQIFTTSHQKEMDNDTVQVPKKVTINMCNELNREFSKAEVKETFFQMNPGKAPSPDGFTALFYQRYWHIVGREVTKVVLEFLNNMGELPNVNHTSIVLISKKSLHQSM